MGCGRGAVLLMAAQRLTTGRAAGVDLWRSVDQSGNSLEATRRNVIAEGVADRVELHTGDMTALPFEDNSFDVVVSSLAIHNISGSAGREKAITEAVRVLRPGGRLMIADIRATRQHEAQLAKLGMSEVARRRLGWRFWWGGPGRNPSRDRHQARMSELSGHDPVHGPSRRSTKGHVADRAEPAVALDEAGRGGFPRNLVLRPARR